MRRRPRAALAPVIAIGALVMTVLCVAQPAQADAVWQQPTPASFWSSAAVAASSTVYAPSSAALKSARAGTLQTATSGLQMYCKGKWSVRAVYGDMALTIDQGADNGASEPPCLGDGPGAGPDLTGTRVNVAGSRVDVYFLGCQDGVSDSQQAGLPEATCPAAKAEYTAFGRLPAVGGKSATVLQMQSVGMTRQQLSRVIASLRAVRAQP